MKFRLVDRIENWKRGQSLTVRHAVSQEEYSLKSMLGENAAAPVSLAIALAAEGVGYLLALDSNFERWADITAFENLQLPEENGPGSVWDIQVSRVQNRIQFSGSVCGWAEYREVSLTDYYDPGERKAFVNSLYRGN